MASIFGELSKTADSAPNPEFVSVDGTSTNPLGRIGDDWGFWCECWVVWNGGYADEASARQGLAAHVRELEGEMDKMREAEKMMQLHEEAAQ